VPRILVPAVVVVLAGAAMLAGATGACSGDRRPATPLSHHVTVPVTDDAGGPPGEPAMRCEMACCVTEAQRKPAPGGEFECCMCPKAD